MCEAPYTVTLLDHGRICHVIQPAFELFDASVCGISGLMLIHLPV